MTKTGRKPKEFEVYGGQTEQHSVYGRIIGLSFAPQNKTYYTMLPQNKKGTVREWLGRDKEKAVLKLRAIVARLKGERELNVSIEKYDTVERVEVQEGPTMTLTNHPKFNKERQLAGIHIEHGKSEEVTFYKKVPKVDISETFFIEWLKKELQNPSGLAKKTGIATFNHFYEWILEKPIKLSDLVDNFFNLRKKPISEKEEQKTRKSWDVFISIIGKETIQEVTLADIQKYEDYIHQKGYSPKTIQHYLNRVGKIFSYNSEKYEDNGKLLKIAKWCEGMERLDDDNSEEPETIDSNTFKFLLDNADAEMKAMLLLGLNTASTFIDLSRFTVDEIDLNAQTLSTRRNKTGKVKKVAYLWDRTVSAIKTHLGTQQYKSSNIFTSRYGKAYTDSGLRKKFKRFSRELKLSNNVKFKHLRDTFSTISKDLDIDPFKINCVMGHSNKGMIDKYSKRQITNSLKEACLKVEQAFFEEEI